MTRSRELESLPKLELAVKQQNWDELSNLLNPKLFVTLQTGELISFQVLAKVAEILTTEDPTVPDNIKIICLKCLGNSCYNGYTYKEYVSSIAQHDKYCHKLYSILSKDIESLDHETLQVYNLYPSDSYFPYEGIAEWTSNYIISCSKNIETLVTNHVEILRLSIQFLCNLLTFACKDSNSPDNYSMPNCLKDDNLKTAIVDFMHSECDAIIKASCIFVHNALKELDQDYFTEIEKQHLCQKLLKPIKEGFQSAKEALLLLICHSNMLQHAYNNMLIEDKLYLLEIIYNEVSEFVYQHKEGNVINLLGKDTIQFLSNRFCKKSDLILKTVDTYLDGEEPTEVIILLEILGVLTSGDSKDYIFLKDDKSLLINCIYLLKSLQMVGKESDNYFTPVQKLSDIAPAGQVIQTRELAINSRTPENEENNSKATNIEKNKSDPYAHPAFGFKAGLIRVIGNMSYRNKVCQDLLRDNDAIPLLLDCCNIDARNPLIMQWTILALRNLCEGNPENQKIIRNCTKVGVVENSVLKEMGLTLHEEKDGQKIGIMPLVRHKDQ